MERSENALAAEVFDQLCSAGTLKSILNYHRQLCDLLHIRPTHINQFYPKLKAKLRSWRAQALWNKFDKRASHKCYNRGKACSNIRLLVIGGGPCGLRTAIEAQLLGAKVVVIEKRDRITRNNVLHLWPFVITDLKALGAKKFFGRFCAGAIDHISIRQLQCILLKVALILGVEIHEGVGFESVIPPPDDQADERVGWRACTSPPDHPVSQYEFNALIGADGKRNTLDGFKRKEFRGKLAIAITANFINRHTEAEARVEEISGVAFIFNQKFFKELYASTGIDLENIVYYKDDTHYFVMTAKKHSLIDKGVIISDYSDTAKLLSPENVDKTALMEYAREAADFSTGCRLPQLEFAVNHYGQPDVAMFDFTSMYAAENASRFIERRGHRLYVTLVGDSLLEPFWPTGSGCARGFLSSMDACWALRSWGLGAHPLEVVAERESIYRLLAQTTPENLHRDLQAYTLDPCTRYPNLNSRSVLPIQMKAQFDTDDSNEVDQFLKAPKNTAAPNNDPPKKRKRREAVVHADTLLHWLQRQVALCDEVSIENVTSSFKDGMALCAILNRYRPHLLDFASLDREDVAKNNQLAFDILEKELAIPPVMTGEEMAECDVPDKLAMLSYLSQVYEAFRGEIPHIKHPKMEETEEGKDEAVKAQLTRIRTLAQMSPQQKLSLLGKLANRPSRKRRSHLNSDRINRSSMDGKGGGNGEEFSGRVKDIEDKLRGTHTDKKPKDLLRAIGKIEKTDWNVKQIEQKIEENRMGRGSSKRSEKVPKWSKQQFEDKFTAVERKLRARSNKADDNKYSDIDITMKKIDKKVKEGFSLEQGKVSAMAEHLAKIHRQPEPAVTPTGKQAAVMMPSQGASELCHFCNKRVYLMERLSAEGRFFHRGCFRCQYCSTSLRLGNYAFDREGKYGHKFFCVQHFGLQGATANRRREEVKPMVTTLPKTPTPSKTSTLQPEEMVDMGSTPERVEFENSTCLEDEVEEDEFTDRNFGLSTTDVSETEGSDSSSESDGFAEAEDGGLDPDLETLRLAKDWTRRYASSYSSDSQDESDTEMEDEEEDDRKKKNQDGSDSGSETEGAKGTIRRSHRAQRQRKIHNMAASHSETIRNRHLPSQSFSVCKEVKTNRNKSWARSALDDGSPTGVSKIQKSKVAPSSSSSLKTNESKQHKTHSEKRFEHSPLGAKPVDDGARSVPKEVPSKSVRLPYSLDSKKPMSPSFVNTNTLSTASGLIEMNANNSSPSIATATQVVQKTIFSVVQPFQSAVGFISKIAEKAVCTVTPSLQKAEVNVVVPAGVHTRPNETVLKERNVNDSSEGLCGNRNSLDSKFNCNPAVPDPPSKTSVLKSGDSDGKVAVRDQPPLKSPSFLSESVRSDQERKIKNVNDEENTFSHHTENCSDSNVQQYPTKRSSGKNSKETVRSAQRPLQIQSDDYSGDESSEEENSATEISTDSEFEHDGTTHTIPDIVISETVQVKRGHLEQPKQVLIVSRQQNGKYEATKPHNDLKLELNRIDTKPVVNNIANNNNRPKPLLNPNRGDYLLNRTQSTEGIASKISLELKKKYLLGPQGLSGNVRKSGSTSTLDTKFKSLIDQISEQQKLLNPAPVPSPTMQAFLQGADKLKISPIQLLDKKTLPTEGFKHICSLKEKEEIKEEKKEEEEVRPRSPVHETSIVVPEFPRSEKKELESDSLSSDLSSSSDETAGEEDDEEGEKERNEEPQLQSPPKLEIHNSRGELMEDAPELDSLNMPDICQAETEKSPIDKLDLVPMEFKKGITVPTDIAGGMVLTQVTNPAELYVKNESKRPESPDSSDSLKNDLTAHTETEMSDWARDEDGVSESLDDLEFINPNYRQQSGPRGVAKTAQPEDFDEYTHVCGKETANPLNLDNLEFMDTGDESSEGSSSRNQLHLNRGYVQFVDEDLTPVAEIVNPLKEELTDTTTTSEPTTVKDSPADGLRNMEYELSSMPGKVPYGTVRDSIEVMKRNQKEIIEPKGNALNSPATARKLEQLSQERTKQKDLIHEMVMNKLIAQGKSPTERPDRKKRLSRNFSPSNHVSPPVEPKVEETPKTSVESVENNENQDSLNKLITPRHRSYTVGSGWMSESHRKEAYSLPDIHNACEFKTPLTTPNIRSGLREQARAKFKMMSDEELGLSPEDKLKRYKLKIQKHLREDTPKSSRIGDRIDSKKSKEDRKKSIIQAVSDFFHKKSPSPPKTPSSHSPTKNLTLNFKKDKQSDAPPVPPPPQAYTPSQEDSLSEEETHSGDNTSLVKKQRVSQRIARQAQSKRLRMAQEVQRQLEELEVKQKELEAQGVSVEKALRGEDTGENRNESELLAEWLRLTRERSEARSKEKMLVIKGQEIELEHRHARLQTQLSDLMSSSPDGRKSSEEVALEGRILREMLEIVERKNSLQGQLQAETQRFQEEDKDLEAQMIAKGLQVPQKPPVTDNKI